MIMEKLQAMPSLEPESPPKRGQGQQRPGRPLGFDRGAALRQAMLLFWRHGYESTSVHSLVAAMGITPPSLYTAFGDKRQLFLEAVRLYTSGSITSETIIDNAASSREAATGLLQAAALGFSGRTTPAGCLLASAAISCSPDAADVQQELAGIRIAIEARLRKKILHDQRTKVLPADCDSTALAAHIMAVIQGMSTLARDGAPRRKLQAVAAIAMRAWPIPH